MIKAKAWCRLTVYTFLSLTSVVVLGYISSFSSLQTCERHHAREMRKKIDAEPETDFVVIDRTKQSGSGADYSKGYEILTSVGVRVRRRKSDDDHGDKGVGISKARVLAPFVVRIESGWMEKGNGGGEFLYFALLGKVFFLRGENLWHCGFY